MKDNAEKQGSDFSERERSYGMAAFDIVNNENDATQIKLKIKPKTEEKSKDKGWSCESERSQSGDI